MLSCRGYIFQHRIRGEEGDGDRKSDAGGCTFKHIEGEECTVMVSGDIVFVFDPTIIRQPQSIWIIHERSWCLSFTFINIFIFYFIYMWNCILAGVNNSLITMDFEYYGLWIEDLWRSKLYYNLWFSMLSWTEFRFNDLIWEERFSISSNCSHLKYNSKE